MRAFLLALVFVCACASSSDAPEEGRAIREFSVTVDRELVLPSSVLQFQILNSADRAASGAEVRFAGVLEGGLRLDESYYVTVDRVGERGDLLVRVRVSDGLFAAADVEGSRRFSGSIVIRLDDAVGPFGEAYVEDTDLVFLDELKPGVRAMDVASQTYVFDDLAVEASGVLMPDEGTTWAVVESGTITNTDGSSRQISNARYPVLWGGSRESGLLKVAPEIFGVKTGRFRGAVTFENELRTGQTASDAASFDVDTVLLPSIIETIDPPAGSRGQRVRLTGRGFLPENDALGYGMYLKFEGTFTPANAAIEPRVYQGSSAVFRAPFLVLDGQSIDQNVWADVTPNGQLSGLGATPGQFIGTVTPVLFDVTGEQEGQPWSGNFDVLPTKQMVFVKFLPGFSRALQNYGLKNVEPEVRARVLFVLNRSYDGINCEFVASPPTSFVEYTTIEIGGPDPSGLLNFGYDNSFNDGGKDLGNLYLSDYLGGVNVHSQDAGYLPYGGVFIESFAAFSPTLFPDNFGTSASFDRIMQPVMPALGGAEVSAEEWPDGARAAAIEAAINLVGTLAGHTAAHEVGHSFGLAYFPDTVDGFAERFHNDPPGLNWLMDAGSDRPFEERAEIDGRGPAQFSPANRSYLQRILPLQ
ncbi:MAG: hypothetical protein R3E66_21580 [bacterium]